MPGDGAQLHVVARLGCEGGKRRDDGIRVVDGGAGDGCREGLLKGSVDAISVLIEGCGDLLKGHTEGSTDWKGMV